MRKRMKIILVENVQERDLPWSLLVTIESFPPVQYTETKTLNKRRVYFNITQIFSSIPINRSKKLLPPEEWKSFNVPALITRLERFLFP